MEKGLITHIFPLLLGSFLMTQKPIQNVDNQHHTDSSSLIYNSSLKKDSSLESECQKTIQYTVETTTTKRTFTASEKLYTPPTLSDPLSIEADTVTMVDVGHCVFLGSSFYNPDNSLKFKIVFKYGTNTEGWQRLESATLSSLSLIENSKKGVFTEVTSVFK